MTQWREEEHPRDDEGKFTYKNGGVSNRESYEDKMQRRADILYPTMKDKLPKVNYDNIGLGLGNFVKEKLSREDILFPSMKDKKEIIKEEPNIEQIKINKKDIDYVTGGAACIQGISNEYIDNLKEINPVKRYENNVINEFKHNSNNQSLDNVPKWSNNTKFSDEELKRARKFIQGIEKFREDAYYPTPNDKLTIGYGHTGLVDGKPIKLGMKITEKKAEELYRQDFETHTAPLKDVEVALTNNQKLALASFLFNLGPNILKGSDLLKKLNKGDFEGAANEFDNYIHQKGKVLKGLIDRRKREKELFLTPDS